LFRPKFGYLCHGPLTFVAREPLLPLSPQNPLTHFPLEFHGQPYQFLLLLHKNQNGSQDEISAQFKHILR
jgi:hypothetical protein